MQDVKDFDIKKGTTVAELTRQMMQSGGFTAKKLADGIDIVKQMTADKNCVNFLSFPADIVATGTRGVLRDMLKEKMFDVVVTTCGTLDHDLARSYKKYLHGSFEMDDAQLHKKGINRLGNVLVPNESYGIIIEDKMREFLKKMHKEKKTNMASYELIWELGKMIGKKDSILYWAWKNKIPVVVPGITDGGVGYQIWQFSQNHDFRVNIMRDETLLSDVVWNAKRTGALIVGGGISKHHVLWWAQFHKGLDYAVYITTAVEYDGSLSGARTREAISWGKIKGKARHVTVEGDATIILPIIFSALK
ncbi:MAG TPA: deoxyhypusine synthase [archaeon]|nr:deoxyhypusine synthase [archaeon]